MNQRRSLPLKFSALRRFDARTGIGSVVAVFFYPPHAASQQQGKARAKQNKGKAEGFPHG